MTKEKETTHAKELRPQPAPYSLQRRSICSRCGGLMVIDVSIELLNTRELEGAARRCIQCGDLIDAVILRNRSLHQQSVTTQHRRASVH